MREREKHNMKNSKAKKIILALLLLAVAVFALALIVMRVCFYRFAFDPKYYSVDYGRFNFFSYFTVQSNLYVIFFLFCLSFALFGSGRAGKIAFNPMVRVTVATYILVTGAVYCGGIPMGMTPPLTWNGFSDCLLSVVQIVHHMVMPPLVLLIFLLTAKESRIEMKRLPIVAVYPFIYSAFSIIRGALSDPQFYAYPFYRPDFFWNIFLNGHEMNTVGAYLIMLPMLIAGVSLFVIIAWVLSAVNNRINKKAQS